MKSVLISESNSQCGENVKPWRRFSQSGITRPFMMMPWMMSRGPQFQKFMNQNCNNSQVEDQSKEQPSSETHCCKADEEPKQDGRCGERRWMRHMRRMMAAYGGGFSPMFPGAMYQLPPWMWMSHHHHKKDGGHCKKNNNKNVQEEKNSSDEEEVVSSNDEMLPGNGEDVTEAMMMEDGDDRDVEILETGDQQESASEADQAEGEGKSPQENTKGKHHHHHRRHQNRRLMREIMMSNGGFPPMWFMMSQQPWRRFHKMKNNNASKKDNEASEEKSD